MRHPNDRPDYDTSLKSQQCSGCRYYSGHYECRRHAPIAVIRVDIPATDRRFPAVQPTDWCGDWESYGAASVE